MSLPGRTILREFAITMVCDPGFGLVSYPYATDVRATVKEREGFEKTWMERVIGGIEKRCWNEADRCGGFCAIAGSRP